MRKVGESKAWKKVKTGAAYAKAITKEYLRMDYSMGFLPNQPSKQFFDELDEINRAGKLTDEIAEAVQNGCGKIISKGGTKSVPNPNGKKGGTAHQNTINSIEKTSANGKMQYETKYNTPNGYKQSRYADAVEIVDGEVTKIHQVGKVNKNGTPLMRESKAIEDIMNSPNYNGVPVYFLPYNYPDMGPIIFDF